MNGTPFRGIFYKIGKHFPHAPITKLVNVTTSGDLSGRGNPIYVIDPHFTILDASNWLTTNRINSSYKFTFLRNSLRLTSYSIKSRTDFSYNLPNELIIEL